MARRFMGWLQFLLILSLVACSTDALPAIKSSNSYLILGNSEGARNAYFTTGNVLEQYHDSVVVYDLLRGFEKGRYPILDGLVSFAADEQWRLEKGEMTVANSILISPIHQLSPTAPASGKVPPTLEVIDDGIRYLFLTVPAAMSGFNQDVLLQYCPEPTTDCFTAFYGTNATWNTNYDQDILVFQNQSRETELWLLSETQSDLKQAKKITSSDLRGWVDTLEVKVAKTEELQDSIKGVNLLKDRVGASSRTTLESGILGRNIFHDYHKFRGSYGLFEEEIAGLELNFRAGNLQLQLNGEVWISGTIRQVGTYPIFYLEEYPDKLFEIRSIGGNPVIRTKINLGTTTEIEKISSLNASERELTDVAQQLITVREVIVSFSL